MKRKTNTWRYLIFILLVLLVTAHLALFFIRVEKEQEQRKTAIELYDPPNKIGRRIRGTNYVIIHGDTLEIKKYVRVDYTYQVLTREQKRAIRKQLQPVRK